MSDITKLVEALAFKRSDAESKITELGRQVLKHVIKIQLYPNSKYVEGWFKEIRAWYADIADYATSLKKNKKFTADQVHEFMYPKAYSIRKLEDLVEAIIGINPKLKKPKYDIHVMHETLLKFYGTMSECAVAGKSWHELQAALRKLNE
jgi:hypothetical protein